MSSFSRMFRHQQVAIIKRSFWKASLSSPAFNIEAPLGRVSQREERARVCDNFRVTLAQSERSDTMRRCNHCNRGEGEPPFRTGKFILEGNARFRVCKSDFTGPLFACLPWCTFLE